MVRASNIAAALRQLVEAIDEYQATRGEREAPRREAFERVMALHREGHSLLRQWAVDRDTTGTLAYRERLQDEGQQELWEREP